MHPSSLLFLSICFGISILSTHAQPSTKPNMIILLSDDHGWGDFSPPLGNSPAQTPNLNAMATSVNAAHFPRFYSGGPVCSPTRATILTGRTNTRDCIINVEQLSLPLQLQGSTIADYATNGGYSTFFAGKWHLGSMSNDTTSLTCYDPAQTNHTCLPGYVGIENRTKCCDGRDASLPRRTPLDFGFQTVFGTSEVAPSSTSNCGCLMTVSGAGEGCNMGHYTHNHTPVYLPGLECDSTWYTTPSGTWEPYLQVTDVDDAQMLVNRLESFILESIQNQKPFLAQVSFHQVHIPYIAPPEFRALYSNYTENEQDYYGAITAMDAQVGRIRNLLQNLGIANNTIITFAADNGPEVNTGDHECGYFVNPGSTNGLQGRKRALLEGGLRVGGIIEAPFLVQGNGPYVLDHYVASTFDYLPTFMQLINASKLHPDWPLDGISLVPALSGQATVRPSPAGWLSDFALEDANATCPGGAARLPPGVNNFTAVAQQSQVSWVDGPLKLVGCVNPQKNWYFRLFNVESDPAETNDLFDSNQAKVTSMYNDLQVWQASVLNSRQVETMCSSQ